MSALANATILAHPLPNVLKPVITDASNYTVGAVHEYLVDGAWQLLGFFNQQLKPHKLKYKIFKRKFLSLYSAVYHRLSNGQNTVVQEHQCYIVVASDRYNSKK